MSGHSEPFNCGPSLQTRMADERAIAALLLSPPSVIAFRAILYVAAKPRRVGQNLCRKQLASTFLDPKIAKESISAIESCHRSRADALQDHFQPTSIYNCQQPDHACINFCLSHSENSVQMHACMICRSEFSPEWLNQHMHGHRPARIRSGGCMTGNRKIMQK